MSMSIKRIGTYAPPAPGALRAAPPADSLVTDGLRSRAYYTWHGRAGDDGTGQPVLPDGFYYLHILLREGADSLWLPPPPPPRSPRVPPASGPPPPSSSS